MTARWSRLPVLFLIAAPGCALKDYLWEPPGRAASDAAVLRVSATSATPSELSPELAAAHEKLKGGDVAGAEKAYHKIAENTKK